MLIREAMASDAEWITPDVLLTEAALRMRDKNIGCLPVGENDRLVGMITDRYLNRYERFSRYRAVPGFLLNTLKHKADTGRQRLTFAAI